jgi:SAM-dependent methyltransferase
MSITADPRTVTDEAGYEDAARWASAASVVYRPLAEALVAASPVPLGAGMRVLDVGTGTGLVADALGPGVQVVGVDRSPAMLAYRREVRPPGINADARWLPFSAGVFDAWIASFLLNHLPPEEPLAEASRVVRPGGVVLASAWPATRDDRVKKTIDELAGAAGWTAPPWHHAMKRDLDTVAGDPRRIVEIARRAGLVDAHARCLSVAVNPPSAEAAVDYRLALPHYAPWAAAVEPGVLARLRTKAARAVEPLLPTWQVQMLVFTARVGPVGR